MKCTTYKRGVIIYLCLKGVCMGIKQFYMLCYIVLIATMSVTARVTPYLSFRSQGFNATRELVGWQTTINKPDTCNFYGSFSITPEYTRSFKPCTIAKYLFCDALSTSCCTTLNTDCCNKPTIKVQGLNVQNRDGKALIAENFYLSTDFDSEITFKPTIDNCIVDFNAYLGLDNWIQGLYFRAHMPVCYTRWDLNFCENIINEGKENYSPGYMNNTTTPGGETAPLNDVNVYGISNKQLLHSFQEYASSQSTITGVEGITYNPLNFARMSPCRQHKVGIAELTAALGWNFINCTDYTLGLNIRGSAPTGNRPHGTWLFEPIVGQGKHWELGGGIDARWVMWRSCDEDRDFTVYLDGNITHLFKSHQCRTFDLCGKPLSRYMLATKFTDQVKGLEAASPGGTKIPKYQFAKEFSPVANITTLPVEVSAAVQGEVVVKCAYTHCNWQFDFGYDFWGRSCEKICKRGNCKDTGFQENTWGLKGNNFMFGFPFFPGEPPAADQISQPATPLSSTDSKATIFNVGGIDNPLLAFQNPPDVALSIHIIGDNDTSVSPVIPLWRDAQTSVDPILITQNDIDLKSAATKSMSNKVFGHIGYMWKDCECLTPYLGIGAEAEFGMKDSAFCEKKNCATQSCQQTTPTTSSCPTTCKKACCSTVSLSQWGVWIKGGIAFN